MTAMEAPPAPGLAVSAAGLTVRGPYGVIFDGVEFAVAAGELLVVHGPARSGRTTLLLAVAGRHRIAAGVVDIGSYRLPQQAAAVRRVVTIAQAEPAVGLEGRLRVAEVIDETRVVGRVGTEEIDAALGFFELDPPGHAFVDDLDPAERTLLAVALAWAQRPPVLVVDDADGGCPPAQRRRVWDALARLAAEGCTVLAGALELPEVAGPAQSVVLPRRTDALHPRPLPVDPGPEEVQP